MAVYTQAVLSPDPIYLQPKSYDARADRKVLADLSSAGIVNAGDFAVSWTSGFNISVAGGIAYVLGQNIADQGMYRQYVSSATVLAEAANTNANPRLDQVILRVMDNAADASGFNEARIEIVPGTPTSGATLANRSGAANLATLGEASKSVLLLADILMPGASGAITGANIGDKRVRATVGAGYAAANATPPAGSVTEAMLVAGVGAGDYGTVFPTTGLFNGYRFTAFKQWGAGAYHAYECIYRADLDATEPWFVVGQTPYQNMTPQGTYTTGNLTGTGIASPSGGGYVWGYIAALVPTVPNGGSYRMIGSYSGSGGAYIAAYGAGVIQDTKFSGANSSVGINHGNAVVWGSGSLASSNLMTPVVSTDVGGAFGVSARLEATRLRST